VTARLGAVSLAVALVAGGALVIRGPEPDRAAATGPVAAAVAWPRAARADLLGFLPDGPLFTPGYFLDARTAIGTAPSPDGAALRLVRVSGSTVRELRRLPLADNPDFGNFAGADGVVVWTESTNGSPVRLWALDTRGRTPARRVTADTGNAVFYGSGYDLVIAGGRVYWTAAGRDPTVTEIRSVALTGGAVRIRRESGVWALSAWPWLTSGEQSLTVRLVNLDTGRTIAVRGSGPELSTCGPTWCRVTVLNAGGQVRVDLMRTGGGDRRRIAGSTTSAAVTDVAVLDRFEILSEAGPDSAVTGTARLLVYDIATQRTVDVSAEVTGAFSRGGVLWWGTGEPDDLTWHTIDLRTV
jgi:hypothetical protein